MANFMSHIAVPIAIGAVALVLLLGLVNMMRGGSGNTSQKLMRLRVLLQFIAIVIIMITIWVMAKEARSGHGNPQQDLHPHRRRRHHRARQRRAEQELRSAHRRLWNAR